MSNKSTTSLESKLTRLLEQYDARQDTNGVRFALAAPKRGWRWEWSSPGSSEQYFIASTTKLYVTALVMQLRAAGQLDLEAPAARYLAPSVMTGIHVLRGVDAGGRITIRELLSHTSGIADYFEQRQRDGSTQIGKALQADFAWTFDDVLRITKDELTPRFAPSTPGKAFYSDTNYQLLGAVIEAVTGAQLRRRAAAAHSGAAGAGGHVPVYPRYPRSLRFGGRNALRPASVWPSRGPWPRSGRTAGWCPRRAMASLFSKHS